VVVFIILLTFLNLPAETTAPSLRGDRRIQRDNRRLNPQQTCQARFEQHNCQQRIDQDPENPNHYLNCNQGPSLREEAISCAWGGVQGIVDIAQGLTMIPALPYMLLVQDQNCSENTENKREILEIIRPLLSQEIYQSRLRTMGCSQLAQWVEQQVERYVSEIDAKQRNQEAYEAYTSRDPTRPDIVANVDRRFPASERTLTEAEQEFYRRYQVRQNAHNEFPNVFERVRRANVCASPQYITELACRGVAGLGAAGAATRLGTGALARRAAADRADPRLLGQASRDPSDVISSAEQRVALADNDTVELDGATVANPDVTVPNSNTRTQLTPTPANTSALSPLGGRTRTNTEELLINGQRIAPLRAAGEGRQGAVFVELDNGLRGVWKPHQEGSPQNARSEVFAFELDRRLGFNAVPETVEYSINGQPGSLQLFREGLPYRDHRREYAMNHDHVFTPSPQQRHEISRQSLFDFLIDNRDRHSMNYMIGRNGQIISHDNGAAFTGHGAYLRTFEERREEIRTFLSTPEGRATVERIRGDLRNAQFRREATDYLGNANAQGLIRRMSRIVNYYDFGMR
jgi:hypothetical protein